LRGYLDSSNRRTGYGVASTACGQDQHQTRSNHSIHDSSLNVVHRLETLTPGAGRALNNVSGRLPLQWTHRALARVAIAACLTLPVACGGGTEPPPPVASVLVSPPSSSISVGQTVQLSAAPRDAQGGTLSDRTVTWSSTNTGVASVSSTGLVTAVTIGGPVTIVATSEGQDGSATVTVTPPPVATVSVSPAPPPLTPFAAVQLSATTRDASGAVLPGRTVTWSSSNNAVATVSGSGVVMGVTIGGPITITATSEGQTGTVTVSVVDPIITSVSVSPVTTAVSIAGTTFITADVRDQNNVNLTKQIVAWTSSNPAIATISPMPSGSQSAVVTGVAAGGPVTVTATIAGKSGTGSVTVTSSPCDASTPITLGQSLSGTLSNTDCALEDGSFMDQYQIAVTANARIQIDVTSSAFDTYVILFLRNPDGTKVAVGADNNSAGGTNARITRDALAGETYVIGANSLLPNITGTYQVSVQTTSPVIAGQAVVIRVRDEIVARAKMQMGLKALR
jgi:uncharacterized protein YjdB